MDSLEDVEIPKVIFPLQGLFLSSFQRLGWGGSRIDTIPNHKHIVV